MWRFLTFLLLLPFAAGLAAGIDGGEFAGRRGKVAAQLDPAAVAIFRSADMKMRGIDVEYRYRQENMLFYLTGVNRPNVTLLLTGSPVTVDGREATRILLTTAEVQREIAANGGMADGVVLDAGRLQELLGIVLAGRTTLYLSAPDLRFVNDWLNSRPLFIDRDAKREVEKKYPGLKVKNAGPLLSPLRGIKSPAEVALISKAIAATREGLLRAMETSAPGVYEYELQGALEGEMLKRGAEYVGFPSIVGSGPNSLILHYSDNRRQMQEGEMVVMDVGAEVEGYSADVTRTFPVGGVFSDPQRELYTAVLDAQKAAIAEVRPGATFASLDRAAKSSLKKAGFEKFLTHGISHHLGLDTHDAGPLDTLRAGMVITIEPGAYIPAGDTTVKAEFRGWGIRIEDDVLVTPDGALVLSKDVPKEISEIEPAMKRR